MTSTSPSKMIFVVGLQRSGTTFVARTLAEHSDVTGLANTNVPEDEGQFLQTVIPSDRAMGRAITGTRSGTQFWSYHSDAHLTESDVSRFPNAFRGIDDAWQPYWADASRPFRIEKSPSTLLRTRFMQELYPEAQFVAIRRHPIEQSLAILKWARQRDVYFSRFSKFFEHWLSAMDTFVEDRPHLRHLTEWRFEDVVAAPEHSFQSMFASLGLVDEQPKFAEIRDSQSPYQQAWKWLQHGESSLPTQFHRRRLPGRIVMNTFRNVCGPAEVRRLTRRFESRFNAFGYSFSDFDGA